MHHDAPMLLRLAYDSLWHRRFTAALCVFSLAVSVFVLASVEFARKEVKESFGRTLVGTDLIVGARGGDLSLLMYSVFRLGDPTNNVSWQSYQFFKSHPLVKWSVPLSLGDSHRGFRVLGTTQDYFKHYRYGDHRLLRAVSGNNDLATNGVVIGATVAARLGYQLGDSIFISHGTGAKSFQVHDDNPLTITGILQRTGTPVDETLHVSLDVIDAIHSHAPAAQYVDSSRTITAFLLGLESRMFAFRLQREVNHFTDEPLTAILPGVALSKLWRLMSSIEHVLQLTSALVLLSALSGMSAMLFATLRERKQEFVVLRTIGVPSRSIFILLELEALILAAVGFVLGVGLLILVSASVKGYVRDQYGLLLPSYQPSLDLAQLALAVLLLAALCGLLPAFSAYHFGRERRHVSD